MSKKTLIGSQRVKSSKTLLKSALHYLCQIFCFPWKKISSKESVLVLSGIMGLFLTY